MRRAALLTLVTVVAACGFSVVGSGDDVAVNGDGGGGTSGAVDADGSINGDGSIEPSDGAATDTGGPINPLDAGPYGTRVTTNLVALYEMQEGAGATLNDTSGFGAPLNATFTSTADVAWVKGGVAALNNNVAVTANAVKVTNAAKASNEVSVEIWVRFTATLLASYARLVTFSTNSAAYNIAVTSKQTSFWYYLSTNDGPTGSEVLLSPSGIMHLVGTYKNGAKSFYVNGALIAAVSQTGSLANWLDTYPLSFFNTADKDRPMFPGELHLVAFYSRALSPAEVLQNFNAGANP